MVSLQIQTYRQCAALHPSQNKPPRSRAQRTAHTRPPEVVSTHSPPDLYMSPQANTQKTNRALGPDGRGASASQRAADISLVQVLKRLPN
jgi:hypothetical protein